MLKDGVALHKKGSTLQAAAKYKEVLSNDPEEPDGLHLLGVCMYEQRNYIEAERLIREALRFMPHQEGVHHNLAAILSVTGRIPEAEGHYREALRLKPDYPEAIYNLSSIIKAPIRDPLISQAKNLIASGAFDDRDLCFLHFAAAKLLDDCGAFDEAFPHFQKGNALKGLQYAREKQEHILRNMKSMCTADFLRSRSSLGLRSQLPIFIVGMPRSGTSLIEQMLSSHSSVFGAGEIKDISSIATNLVKFDAEGTTYPANLTTAKTHILNGMGKTYLEKLQALSPQSSRVINKMPSNFWHLGLISTIFPKCTIIHCQRNPLDTALSCFFQNFTHGQEFSFDLRDIAHYHLCYQEMMQHWRETLPIPMLEFQYEDLVTHPEKVTKDILAFVGLPWEEACAKAHRTNRPVESASRWQVRQPVYQSSKNRWKNYEKHLGNLRKQLLDG